MNQQEILDLFKRVDAIVTDSHVVYTSGMHGSEYIDKYAVYPHTREVSQLCGEMATRFTQDGIEVVVGPAIGAVILAHNVARHLSKINGRDVLAGYAHRKADSNEFELRHAFQRHIQGKRILMVEDILTTGDSALRTIEAVRAAGGDIVGLVALCNRGNVTAESLGVPRLSALVTVTLEMWDEKDCPLCAKNIRVNTTVGHGKAFLDRKTTPAPAE